MTLAGIRMRLKISSRPDASVTLAPRQRTLYVMSPSPSLSHCPLYVLQIKVYFGLLSNVRIASANGQHSRSRHWAQQIAQRFSVERERWCCCSVTSSSSSFTPNGRGERDPTLSKFFLRLPPVRFFSRSAQLGRRETSLGANRATRVHCPELFRSH